VLFLACFTWLVWLLKLIGEIASALVFGVIGGLCLIKSAIWFLVRTAWRLVRWIVKRALPYIGAALEELIVWMCIVWMWCAFHVKRYYVRREIKARRKRK
jgi:hypothetical protein